MAARAEEADPKITTARLAIVLLFGPRQADKLFAQPEGAAFDVALREVYRDHSQGSALADLKFGEDPIQLYKDPSNGKTRSSRSGHKSHCGEARPLA